MIFNVVIDKFDKITNPLYSNNMRHLQHFHFSIQGSIDTYEGTEILFNDVCNTMGQQNLFRSLDSYVRDEAIKTIMRQAKRGDTITWLTDPETGYRYEIWIGSGEIGGKMSSQLRFG